MLRVRERTLDPLELALRMSHLAWALGAKLGSSAGTVRSFVSGSRTLLGLQKRMHCTLYFYPCFSSVVMVFEPSGSGIKKEKQAGLSSRSCFGHIGAKTMSVECTLVIPCPAAHPCSLCLLLHHSVLFSIPRGRILFIHMVSSMDGLRFIRKQLLISREKVSVI